MPARQSAVRGLPPRSQWLAALSCGFLLAGAAHADEERKFSVLGFGTLGVVRTSSDAVEFVRDLSQASGATDEWTAKIDSVLGIQADWQFAPKWQATAQAISRYRFDRSFHPELAWAFVKHEPTPNLSLRAGRLGTDFFMLADSRWVGYSILTVRPPGDYFWYLPFYSIHGADLNLSVPLGEAMLRGKVFHGLSRGQIPLGEARWDIAGSPMSGGYLEYQRGPWQIRGGYARIRFERDLPLTAAINRPLSPAVREALAVRRQHSDYYSLGVVYEQGPWQAQLMLNRIVQESRALENSHGGYLLAGYRTGVLTPYLGYSWVRSSDRMRPDMGDALNTALVDMVMADAHSDQRTLFAGVRWDLARNVAMKAQWDHIDAARDSLFPYRNEQPAAWNGRVNVLSLALDFIF